MNIGPSSGKPARGAIQIVKTVHPERRTPEPGKFCTLFCNQVRLVLHTAAYWRMLKVRDTIPKQQALATAEFTTLRTRLFKIAARIMETATHVRVVFATPFADAALFRGIAGCLQPAGP